MWGLVEHQVLRVEPLCGTLWNLNFESFESGTFMGDLVKPELVTVEPLCGTR